jgi:hypothetical protein
MASMALAHSSKARAKYNAIGRSCGARIATSTLMWSGRPPHEELGLLKIIEVARMAEDSIEPLGEVLHRGSEREPAKLRQTRVAHRRAKLEMAQLL